MIRIVETSDIEAIQLYDDLSLDDIKGLGFLVVVLILIP